MPDVTKVPSGWDSRWQSGVIAERTSNSSRGASPQSSFNSRSMAVLDTKDAYLASFVSRLEDPQRAFLVESESQMSFVRRTQVLYLGSVALASLLSAALQIYHRYMCCVCVCVRARVYKCVCLYTYTHT